MSCNVECRQSRTESHRQAVTARNCCRAIMSRLAFGVASGWRPLPQVAKLRSGHTGIGLGYEDASALMMMMMKNICLVDAGASV
jgi:hypothetical protein